MKKTGSTVTPPDFSGLSVHLCCNEQSATGGQAGNVGRVKTNGKRGSAFVLLYEGSAYLRFCDFSWDASIASLTDTAASDQIAFVMLKSPDAAVKTCRTASQLAGDCLAENTLTRVLDLKQK